MTRLRAATRDDLPRLQAIEAACFGTPRDPDAMADELARSWSTVLVAESSDSVVAYITVWRVADEVEVIHVATHPEARRAGAARALMQRVIVDARARAATRVLLEVRPSNVAAVSLYRALGFAEIARRRGYYDDGEDAAVMVLVLS